MTGGEKRGAIPPHRVDKIARELRRAGKIAEQTLGPGYVVTIIGRHETDPVQNVALGVDDPVAAGNALLRLAKTGHDITDDGVPVEEMVPVVAAPLEEVSSYAPMCDALGALVLRHGPIEIGPEELERMRQLRIALDFRADPALRTISVAVVSADKSGGKPS